jgi:hypothetical protein
LADRPFGPREVSTAAARSAAQLTGRYPLDPAPAGTPLPAGRLGPAVAPTQLTNSVAVALPATPSLLLGGTLRAGERVDLSLVPPSRDGQVHPPVVFTDVLVLDVRSNQLARVADIRTPEPTRMPEAGTIVIAIPAHRRDEFAAASAGATMLLTRHT